MINNKIKIRANAGYDVLNKKFHDNVEVEVDITEALKTITCDKSEKYYYITIDDKIFNNKGKKFYKSEKLATKAFEEHLRNYYEFRRKLFIPGNTPYAYYEDITKELYNQGRVKVNYFTL